MLFSYYDQHSKIANFMFTNIKWDNFGQRVEVFSGGKVKLVKSEK